MNVASYMPSPSTFRGTLRSHQQTGEGAQPVIRDQQGQTATQEQAYHIENGAVVIVATDGEVACLLVKGKEREVKHTTDLKYALPHTTRTQSIRKYQRQKFLRYEICPSDGGELKQYRKA